MNREKKLEVGYDASVSGFGLSGGISVNFGYDGYNRNKGVSDELKKRFNHEEAVRELSAANAMSNAFDNSFEVVQKISGTTHTERTDKIKWQADGQRVQVWRKIKTTLTLNGVKSETIDEVCVLSLKEEPSKQELKNMTLDYLSRYYFNGLKVTSPVFEVNLNLAKHKGPTVKELTTIQKFTNTLTNKVETDFQKLDTKVSENHAAISGLKAWKEASTGTIVIWSGHGRIPPGWALCDGKDGRPDLRNRFVYGGNNQNNGVKGGKEYVLLDITQIPSHAHDFLYKDMHNKNYHRAEDLWKFQWAEPGNAGMEDVAVTTVENYKDKKRHGRTEYVGGNRPHLNMPPYYTLAYIIKL